MIIIFILHHHFQVGVTGGRALLAVTQATPAETIHLQLKTSVVTKYPAT